MNNIEIIEDFYTGSDGRRLFFRHVQPAEYRGVIMLLHGYREHSGRYLETIRRFAERGYAVFCPDHRGFGRSEHIAGDIESIEAVSKDIAILTTLAKQSCPGDSTIIVGHSLGGLLALYQLLNHHDEYDLAVLSGPAVLPPPGTNALLSAIAGLVARFAPQLPVQEIDLTRATRDDAMIARDDADTTLYRGRVRARTGNEVLKTQRHVLESIEQISLPILLLHGSDDRIIDPKASEIVYEGVRSKEKERIVFPGLYHEVFNEPERDKVFKTVFSWIERTLQQTHD